MSQATEWSIRRRYTKPQVHPFDEVQWERRSAVISGEDGKLVFEQRNVEVPVFWSQMATNVVVSKYFRGALSSPERESSVRQLISRVVDTIAGWGRKQGYFASEEEADAFQTELCFLMLHQYACFNSPVWFNVGVEAHPQCSACFINSVEDTMESILGLARIEGMLFKFGSGTGTNLSPLRSSRELVGGGGTASGPVSFMRGFDAFAGVIKSGGKTRRAAKMVILNADHPDILQFIRCKAHEEQKAWALIEAGYDGSFNGEAYNSVFFQNSNNSVRVTDEFMRAVEEDLPWSTRLVTTGEIAETYQARDLMREICEAAWICGDPGLQFHTTINRWHTCPNTAPIHASNPCSEYMFLDNTACNLASLNLLRFTDAEGRFDIAGFRHAVDVMILAQEIIVDNASYPTPRIEENSHLYRPLGLGYANLGALLMARGVPYDSDEGRHYAAALTALMCGEAYAMSARIAERKGPFEGYAANREPMLHVMQMHRQAVEDIDRRYVPDDLLTEARAAWDEVLARGELSGLRNAQATVLAPTGTIGFMMDCDTTGIEPDIALVKYKKLSGGGMLTIVNQTVPRALARLGYAPDQVKEILAYIQDHDTIEGAPHLREEHLPVFDCAFRPTKGERSIAPMGHVRMMAAVQPFLSGAISKTVNMPHDATPEDIHDIYMQAWKLGLKAIAIYRDGCKRSQPLNTSVDRKAPAATPAGKRQTAGVDDQTDGRQAPRAVRHRLPDTRRAITHKFDIAGHEGYITVGMYENGQPGEIFLVMSKEGSVVSGLMDSFATAISLALQYGVPLEALVGKFSHARFEPSGMTKNPQIRFAKSVVDYIFRWLASQFLDRETQEQLGIIPAGDTALAVDEVSPAMRSGSPGRSAMSREATPLAFRNQEDAIPCHICGAMMVRNGACYKCCNCGAQNGCS